MKWLIYHRVNFYPRTAGMLTPASVSFATRLFVIFILFDGKWQTKNLHFSFAVYAMVYLSHSLQTVTDKLIFAACRNLMHDLSNDYSVNPAQKGTDFHQDFTILSHVVCKLILSIYLEFLISLGYFSKVVASIITLFVPRWHDRFVTFSVPHLNERKH